MFFLIFLGLDFQITNYFVPDTFLKGKKKSDLGLVFNGHLYCVELFAWSPPAALFVRLGACYCLWDIACLIRVLFSDF